MQYLMPTYQAESIRVLGYVAPFTETNAEYVAARNIELKLKKGIPVERLMLQHNAGGNAAKCSSGINKNGTPYDSCAYVAKAMDNYKQLIK
jgi:hypothetical protein